MIENNRALSWATGRIHRPLLLGVAVAASIAMAVVPSSARATSGDDWTMFHRDASHSGVSPDTAIGASTASGLTEKWSQLVGGGGQGKASVYASPAVVFNATLQKTVVYDVSVLGQVHAFDAATGATIWSVQYTPGAFVSSPAVDGNTIYFTGTDGILYMLNATTGAFQCSFSLPIVSPETVPGRIESSPVVGHVDTSGPIVFFGDEGQDEKHNAGHEWAVTGIGNTAGSCQLKWVFNGFANKGTHGYNSGSWSEPGLVQNSAGAWLLVFGSSQPDDSVYALNASTGTQVWRFQTIQNGGDQDVGAGPTISAPGLNGFADGVVYIDGKDKIEYALDLATGAQMWMFDMANDSGRATNSVSVAALTGNDLVVGYSRYLYDLNATTGAKTWRSAATAATILASPAISGAAGDQVAFIGDLKGVERGYRLSDGAVVFSTNVGGKIHSSAAIADNMLFVGSDNGTLNAWG
jgi:outer membrane protein assembly factor BamB